MLPLVACGRGTAALMLAFLCGLMLVQNVAAAFELSGTVTGPGGLPLDDVDLDVDDLITGDRIQVDEDDTNANGRYSFELPAGVYRITFEPPAGALIAARSVAPVPIESDTRLDIQLEAGVSLTGRVTGPDGRGVTAVDIDVVDLDTGSKVPVAGDETNALGFYTIVVRPGFYRLDFEPPSGTRLVPVRIDSLVVEENAQVPVHFEEGFIVTGKVHTRTGTPVAGVDADVVDRTTGTKVLVVDDKSDSAGEFTLVLRPGEYELTLGAPLETRLVALVVPDLVVTSDAAVTYALDQGISVTGTVSDADGRALDRVDLDFIRQPDGTAVATPADFTDELGRYGVVVPSGVYDIVATPPSSTGWEPDTARAVTITEDAVVDFRFGAAAAPPDLDPGPEPAPSVPMVLPPFPNPTSGAATIPLRVDPARGAVDVRIYDVHGRLVRELSTAVSLRSSSVTWDGFGSRGQRAPAGVYFVRIAQAGLEASARLLVVPPRR